MIFNDIESKPDKILAKLKRIYERHYQNGNIETVESVLHDVIDLFDGKMNGFQKCDVQYHDLLHTLETVPPFMEIVDGWNLSENSQKVSQQCFDTGVIAVLLHDTGYIKKDDDKEGTGAKYTFEHIRRSMDFAECFLPGKGFARERIEAVNRLISCTGVHFLAERIYFKSEEERVVGYALGTADLLGQMASPDYLDKLPVLYGEFEEAYRYVGLDKLTADKVFVFQNADDLIRSTINFYEVVVKERFQRMDSLFKYVNLHFDTPINPYIEAIEKNMERLKKYINGQSRQS